ncbi:MAG: hypothetical protein IKQ46_05410 [Bacteroidales bacterium]|nr:hypothetical protein [Bacteroidales bacterium]
MKKISKLDLEKKMEIQEMRQIKAGQQQHVKTKSDGGTTKSQANDHDSAN